MVIFHSSRCFDYVWPCCSSFFPPACWCCLFRVVNLGSNVHHTRKTTLGFCI
jgi:hypothetical protein